MSTFTLTMDTGNSAFENDEGGEVARILRVAADRIEHGRTDVGRLWDANGNTVGEYRWAE